MEVVRARKREQGGREARRLEAAVVALYFGGIEGTWVAIGR